MTLTKLFKFVLKPLKEEVVPSVPNKSLHDAHNKSANELILLNVKPTNQLVLYK